GHAAVLILGAILGVMIGRHLENGENSNRYVGTQFTLAVLITLVPDNYANATIKPSLDRLLGIIIGMGVLEPVLLAWHLLRPQRPQSRQDAKKDELGSI